MLEELDIWDPRPIKSWKTVRKRSQREDSIKILVSQYKKYNEQNIHTYLKSIGYQIEFLINKFTSLLVLYIILGKRVFWEKIFLGKMTLGKCFWEKCPHTEKRSIGPLWIFSHKYNQIDILLLVVSRATLMLTYTFFIIVKFFIFLF